MPKFIILTGPSCVGKSPLLQAVQRVYPDLRFGQTIRYTSRNKRPGERDGVDFHFRSAEEIRALPSGRFFIYPMRNLWQALDLDEVERLLSVEERVFSELYPPQIPTFLEHPRILDAAVHWEIRTVFMTPLTGEELKSLSAHAPDRPIEAIVAEIMRIKQIWRALKQGKLLTAVELEDIDIRARHAYAEMQYARNFSDIIVNHDGEESDHWRFTPPIGEAGRTLRQFAAIME